RERATATTTTAARGRAGAVGAPRHVRATVDARVAVLVDGRDAQRALLEALQRRALARRDREQRVAGAGDEVVQDPTREVVALDRGEARSGRARNAKAGRDAAAVLVGFLADGRGEIELVDHVLLAEQRHGDVLAERSLRDRRVAVAIERAHHLGGRALAGGI